MKTYNLYELRKRANLEGFTKERKFIPVDDLSKLQQLSCLESWCASRHKGEGKYCVNCLTIIELGGHI